MIGIIGAVDQEAIEIKKDKDRVGTTRRAW